MATLLKELRSIEAALKELQERRPLPISQQSVEWGQYRTQLSTSAYAALCDFERYRGSVNLMLTMGNGAGTIRPEFFLPKLLDITATRGALFAVKALRRLFAADRAKVKSQCLIWGVEVPHPIRLGPDLQIKPLPPDLVPAILQGEINRLPRHLQVKSSFSILSTEFVVSPVVMEAAECDRLTAPAATAYDKFRDVAAILCAIGPGPVKLEQWWNEFADPKLAAISPIGGPSIFMQEVIPFLPSGPVRIDASVRGDVQRFLNLSRDVRNRLRGPLDRMNTGMCRRSHTDQALDCGIALEMLLGDEAATEISYRLALRAALFLGNTLIERRHFRKQVRDLYTLRSKAAHGSQKPHKGSQEIAMTGFSVCAAIVRKIVKHGSFPRWADLELGSEPLKR